MTPDERASKSTTGGRGRRGSGKAANGGSGSGDPRIVGRRPARSAATDEAGRAIGEAKRQADATREPAPDRPAASAAREQPARTGTRRGGRGRTRTQEAPAEQPATSNGAEADVAVDGDVVSALGSFGRALDNLGERIARLEKRQRLGVFVDVPNVIYGAERSDEPINMGKLLELLAEGRDLIRATAYSPVSDDPSEPVERQKFVAPFVPYEYRIVTKPLKRFADGSIKGNFDVEMAVDMVTMAERLDVVSIVSGDADFARVVEVIQSRGVRVEVVAFQNSTSAEMRALADHYIELSAVIDDLH